MTAVLVQKLQAEYDTLRGEFQVCRRKLDSKCEALTILSQELGQCRSERDQFKLMAEQLRERYQGLKRQLAGLNPRSSSTCQRDLPELPGQSLALVMCDLRDSNKSLKFEADDLRQKLSDARGDIKLLREQIARQRVGTTDEGLTTRHFPAHEREELVKQLEAAQEQYVQLQRDLQQCLDEKEELVTERDVYKNKYERLNTELNYILKGDEKRIIDIDAISMENKYLQERLKQMEEEKSMAMATVSKYKSLLERKKHKGIMKLGQTRSGGVVITQRQVKDLLDHGCSMSASPQTLDDLQSVARALLDTVNDKNLALSHQRKTNKILGGRVAELEKKLKTLEVSGLWNIPGRSPSESLEKLKMEFEDMKMLIPDDSSHDHTQKDILDELDSPDLSPESTPIRLPNTLRKTLPLEEDLDLLPTKEDVSMATHPIQAGHVTSQQNEVLIKDNQSSHHSANHHYGDGDGTINKPEGCVVRETNINNSIAVETYRHDNINVQTHEVEEEDIDEETSLLPKLSDDVDNCITISHDLPEEACLLQYTDHQENMRDDAHEDIDDDDMHGDMHHDDDHAARVTCQTVYSVSVDTSYISQICRDGDKENCTDILVEYDQDTTSHSVQHSASSMDRDISPEDQSGETDILDLGNGEGQGGVVDSGQLNNRQSEEDCDVKENENGEEACCSQLNHLIEEATVKVISGEVKVNPDEVMMEESSPECNASLSNVSSPTDSPSHVTVPLLK